MSRKNTRSWFSLVLLSVAFLGGCAGEPASDEDDGTTDEAQVQFIGSNSLLPAALVHGGKFAEAPLSRDAMPPESILAIEDPSDDGYYARLFLKYAVSCALGPGESFKFTWNDGQRVREEVYEGLMALAPSWANQPLDEEGRAWISACMVARTNRYGIPRMISMRGESIALDTTDGEIDSYVSEEGAFWGDLFAAEPRARACYVPENKALAYSETRECASKGPGKKGCGIIKSVGTCAAACGALGPDSYHLSCGETSTGLPSAEKTKYVITVFLK